MGGPIAAGRLDKRVQIKRLPNPPGQDNTGDVGGTESDDASWVLVAERWAGIEPLVGREFWKGEERAELSKMTHWIVLRYLASVTPKMRVYWKQKKFKILWVRQHYEDQLKTLLMVEEVL